MPPWINDLTNAINISIQSGMTNIVVQVDMTETHEILGSMARFQWYSIALTAMLLGGVMIIILSKRSTL